MNIIQTAAAVIVSIGTISGGALVVETRYTPQGTFYRHVADSKTGVILDLVQRAQGATGDYKTTLCRALIEELGSICSDAPGHFMCSDRDAYIKQAGC